MLRGILFFVVCMFANLVAMEPSDCKQAHAVREPSSFSSSNKVLSYDLDRMEGNTPLHDAIRGSACQKRVDADEGSHRMFDEPVSDAVKKALTLVAEGSPLTVRNSAELTPLALAVYCECDAVASAILKKAVPSEQKSWGEFFYESKRTVTRAVQRRDIGYDEAAFFAFCKNKREILRTIGLHKPVISLQLFIKMQRWTGYPQFKARFGIPQVPCVDGRACELRSELIKPHAQGDAQALQYIDQGFSLTHKDEHGHDPLYYAVGCGRTEVIRAMLDNYYARGGGLMMMGLSNKEVSSLAMGLGQLWRATSRAVNGRTVDIEDALKASLLYNQRDSLAMIGHYVDTIAVSTLQSVLEDAESVDTKV